MPSTTAVVPGPSRSRLRRCVVGGQAGVGQRPCRDGFEVPECSTKRASTFMYSAMPPCAARPGRAAAPGVRSRARRSFRVPARMRGTCRNSTPGTPGPRRPPRMRRPVTQCGNASGGLVSQRHRRRHHGCRGVPDVDVGVGTGPHRQPRSGPHRGRSQERRCRRRRSVRAQPAATLSSRTSPAMTSTTVPGLPRCLRRNTICVRAPGRTTAYRGRRRSGRTGSAAPRPGPSRQPSPRHAAARCDRDHRFCTSNGAVTLSATVTGR